MIKKLIIGGIIVAIVIVAILFLIPWGNYESDLTKSDLKDNVTAIDSSGNIVPTLDELQGVYHVESGEDQVAELLFEIDGLKNTKGAFEKFKISLNIMDDFTDSKADVLIESASVNTNNKMRDESLVSDEFFNAEKFPLIEYHSDGLVFSDSIYTLNGSLTLMGETNDLNFGIKHVGSGTNKNKEDFEAFEGSFEFDRTEYGMPEEGGVGNMVTISFYCELIKTS